MAECRYIGGYPVIGIRPIVDGRRGPMQLRESLEGQVMAMANAAKKLFEEKELNLKISQDAKEFLATRGFNPIYGARPLKRTIRQLVENPLAKKILAQEYKANDTITIDTDGDNIIFK